MPDGSVPRRVFIVGEQGQAAKALARAYAANNDIVVTAGRATVDIADPVGVRRAIADFKPELIVNAAAYTAVDKAEDEAARAFSVNRDGARHVAAAARMAAAPLIHISTDYVFNGAKPEPYVEADEPKPLGIYGRSKLEGEAAIAAEMSAHVILRTSWLCSPDGTNFVKTMLRLAGQREEIGVVDDQWGAPTFAVDLAAAIVTIGQSLMSKHNRGIYGVYHASGSGATTWCGFARDIMKHSAALGGPTARVHPITTSEYPTRARRPANSRLDCSKLERAFGIRLPPWQRSNKGCVDQLIAAPQDTKI